MSSTTISQKMFEYLDWAQTFCVTPNPPSFSEYRTYMEQPEITISRELVEREIGEISMPPEVNVPEVVVLDVTDEDVKKEVLKRNMQNTYWSAALNAESYSQVIFGLLRVLAIYAVTFGVMAVVDYYNRADASVVLKELEEERANQIEVKEKERNDQIRELELQRREKISALKEKRNEEIDTEMQKQHANAVEERAQLNERVRVQLKSMYLPAGVAALGLTLGFAPGIIGSAVRGVASLVNVAVLNGIGGFVAYGVHQGLKATPCSRFFQRGNAEELRNPAPADDVNLDNVQILEQPEVQRDREAAEEDAAVQGDVDPAPDGAGNGNNVDPPVGNNQAEHEAAAGGADEAEEAPEAADNNAQVEPDNGNDAAADDAAAHAGAGNAAAGNENNAVVDGEEAAVAGNGE